MRLATRCGALLRSPSSICNLSPHFHSTSSAYDIAIEVRVFNCQATSACLLTLRQTVTGRGV